MLTNHRLNSPALSSRILSILVLVLFLGCSSCALPQVQAEERLFLPLSVEFLDEYILPAIDYEGTAVGGLSAIAYNRQSDRLYALSDDRGSLAPPRFYTLRLHFDAGQESSNNLDSQGATEGNPVNTGSPVEISSVEIEAVTVLSQENGDPFPVDTIDPEGLMLSPEGTLFISSEGVTNDQIDPWIDEFDLASGQRLRRLPIPPQYRFQESAPGSPEGQSNAQGDSQVEGQSDRPMIGVQNNQGFEALALSAAGMGMGNDEPFRVFAGIENPLIQDANVVSPEAPQPSRILHYIVSPDQSFVLSEHVYPIEPLPFGAVTNGLVELMALGAGGHFLSLERSYGLGGVRAKLFQTTFSDATDTATFTLLAPNATASATDEGLAEDNSQPWLDGIQPMRKQLVLDLYDLGITLDNLEGMTLGPRLPDGSQSLILVSDNNFNPDEQVTQLLLFRINGLPPML